MNRFDIYLIGVGGQGIGLLSETLIRAADHAGLPVSGVDTHGLAQRGGMVVSHVRLGSTLTSPLVRRGRADLVIALERTEAYRALFSHVRSGGTMVCYDTSWQTLKARFGEEKEITRKDLEKECSEKDIALYMVRMEELEDYRMQNMVILGEIASRSLIPSIKTEDYEKAMKDLMDGVMLEKNLALFRQMTD